MRIATVKRISNPEFYDEFIKSGYPVLDISQSCGMTFIDCIAIQSIFEKYCSSWFSILFHELVHAVQCDILGSRRLVEIYLQGWAEQKYTYDDTPLEAQAYILESRFRSNCKPFSVREAVMNDFQLII